MLNHTGENPYTCELCLKQFKDAKNFKKHSQLQEENPYSCETCKKLFKQTEKLESHMLVHTRHESYSCDKQFTTALNLHMHGLSHIGGKPHGRSHTGGKPYTFELCQRHFTDSRNLMTHMLLHTKTKLYTCDVCHKKFEGSDSITKQTLFILEINLLGDPTPTGAVKTVRNS